MTYEQFVAQYRDTIPNQPGVYRYFNSDNEIIYIGKAKDLRKRVSSYFTKNDHTNRIRMMIHAIQRLEFTIVETEQDALLLENSLIKEHQPRYNVSLRDDKTYPYIVIKKERFPRVFLTRQYIRDGSEYLGPYTSVQQVRTILQMLISLFPIRNCTLALTQKNIEAGKFKVCLEYHLKNCLGPCESRQSEEEYNEHIANIREVLKSNFPAVVNYLTRKMNAFAAELQFEKANEWKEKIETLERYQSKSTIVNPRLTEVDVYGYAETETQAFINFMRIANGTVVQVRSMEMKRVLQESKEELLAIAISDFSLQQDAKPKELLLPFDIDMELEGMTVTIPQLGDKKKLVELATKNSLYAKHERVQQSLTAEEKKPSFRIMRTLKDDLKLRDLPRHIECFDNSNFQGTNAVSAIVVFRDAKPSKKDYRFFNVKTVEGPDDFATMEEAVYRRYRRMLEEGEPLPNLIIIDGGKGQLSAAVSSLQKLNIYGQVPVIGIAKRLEEIYFPGDTIPIYINKKSESLKLIQQLRDEAHRFGITAHRNKRSKNFVTSELTQIKGIGEKTMETLLQHFKSIRKLKAASEEDIAAIIGTAKAVLVVQGLNQTSNQQ
ncbi:MAG: excinuclease ABC subunit UvrC [Chitinophagales bacterium]